MDDLAPAVGPDTIILPVLNGMRHDQPFLPHLAFNDRREPSDRFDRGRGERKPATRFNSRTDGRDQRYWSLAEIIATTSSIAPKDEFSSAGGGLDLPDVAPHQAGDGPRTLRLEPHPGAPGRSALQFLTVPPMLIWVSMRVAYRFENAPDPRSRAGHLSRIVFTTLREFGTARSGAAIPASRPRRTKSPTISSASTRCPF
jgi:hypothetical protein